MKALIDDLVPDELWALVEPLLPAPPHPGVRLWLSSDLLAALH